ncbi:MAG: hypothetical protein QMD32_01650 [Smithellaceae bacterium]|nr:hypothetical protein [Smithellaceae bacterium]
MTILIFHAGMMTIAFLLLCSALWVARFYRKSGAWLRVHRSLAVAGCGSVWLGFILALIMRYMDDGEHFRILHAQFGIIVLLFVSWTPAIGYSTLRRVRAHMRAAMLHRWSGRATVTISLLTIISGLFRVLTY